MYIYANIGYDTKILESYTIIDFEITDDPCMIPVTETNEDWIQRKKWDETTQTFVDVSLSETNTRNSLEFTHKDANGTKHWLDEFINEHGHSASDITSGTLPINRGGTGSTSSKQSVTLTCGTDADSSSFGYTCKHIPYLNMCFVRVYAQPNAAFTADTEYEIATLSNATYKPANMMALSNYAQKEVSAYINTEGKIVVRPYESVSTSYGIRLAGFWFCE